MLAVGVVAWLCAGFLGGSAAAQTTLAVGNVCMLPGDTAHVPVELRAELPVVALQFDLTLDPGKLTFGQPTNGPALADHLVDCNELAPGYLRVLLSAPTNTALNNGTLVTIPVTAAQVPDTLTPLALRNVVVSDANGVPVRVDDWVSGTAAIGPFTLPRFVSIWCTPDGLVWFTLIGPTGRDCVIEASPALETWQPVSTNRLEVCPMQLNDATATGWTQRFYRAFLVP